ncbi:hypothetical protein [Pedobacter zeae]|uniref:Phage tail tape measure protein n=1 Tax=Pedobacter zeae TaxID=1737356 RepID=A0A7W6K7J1_9SPHI|nr:hypothetical protein [Pedobacter zeae]MBB4106616.1 hypothetical protein [Pedobacter zeae]GGH02737.1 hypothetical protein GCM10007422_17360 [Pedobacter zeae]
MDNNRFEINCDFLINNEQVRSNTRAVQNNIEGIGQTSERVRNQVNRNIVNTVSQTGAAAAHARTQFNGLQNSINQISRELPAFTYSAQTGFMAISNNLPILVDQIARLRAENQALVASGQKAVPVWKQVVSGLFSWGTVMSVGITLLTVYGKEIGNWIKSLFSSRDALEAVKKSQENLTEVRIKAAQSLAIGTAQLEAYIAVAKNEKLNLDQRQEAVRNIIKLDKERLGGITLETLKTGEATAAINLYIDALKRQSIEKAISSKREDLIKQRYDNKKDYEAATKKVDELKYAVDNQKFKNKASDEETATEAAYRRAKVAREKEFQKDKDLIKQIADLDDYAKKQYEASVKPEGNQKHNRQYFQDIIDTAQAGLDALDKLAPDFVTRSKAYIKTINDAKKELLAFDANNDLKLAKQGVKDQDAYMDTLAGRKDMLDKMAALDAEYAAKQMTSNEEEQAELKNKFNDFRKLIEQENRRISEYNKKHPIKIALIDAKSIDGIETGAMSDLVYRQQTEGLKKATEEEKKIYKEFEEYKATYGADKAKKKFKDRIDVEKSYMQQVEGEMAKLLEKDPTKMSGAEIERLQMYTALQKEAEEAENARLDKALNEFQSYADKRLAIQVKYLDKAKEFRDQGNTKEANEAIAKGNEEVSDLDKTNVAKWGSYKRLFDGVGVLTRRQTLDTIAQFEKELKAAKITNEARMELEQKLNRLKASVKNGSARDIEQVAAALGKVSGEFGKINSDIGDISSTLLTAVQAYVEVRKNLADINDPDKSTAEKVGAGLGIVGAAFSVGNAVVGYFKGLKAAKEAAQKAMNDFQTAAIKGEQDYQALLRQRELTDAKRNKNSYKAIIDQLELLKKNTPEIEAAYNRIFASIQGEQFVEGIGYKHGTWLRKAKTWDVMASLAGSDYAKLEQLYTQGKLKDQAKADFEALRALKEELEAVGVSVEELQQQLAELLTGTTVGGLADGLTALFQNGKMMAADFGQSFESIMRNAVVNSFKVKFLQDQLAPFFTQLAELMKGGTPTQEQIEALKAQYTAIGAQGAEQWKQLEKVFGIKLSDTADNTSITGTIKREITEQTGSELVGLNRSIYDVLKRYLKIGSDSLSEIRQQTLLQMEIAANTAGSWVELKNAVKELKDINKNTKPGSTGYDRGI